MGRGGKRPGAGRPPGLRNKKTMEQVAAVQESGITPLDYMLSVMRAPSGTVEDAVRLDAAKAAAPYVHPRLSTVDATVTSVQMTQEEWLTWLAEQDDESAGD
jgi:hypothetical protein